MKDWVFYVLLLFGGVLIGIIITLSFGQNRELLTPLASIGGFVTIVSIFIKSYLEYKSKIEISEQEQKRLFFGKLCGMKNRMRWLYYNYYDNYVEALICEGLYMKSKTKFYEEQERRYRKNTDDLQSQFGEAEDNLIEILARISLLFPSKIDFKAKIKQIESAKLPDVEHWDLKNLEKMTFEAVHDSLHDWASKQLNKVVEWLKEKIEQPLDEIIEMVKI